MFGRLVPFHQIAFATLVGVVGGVYIYRPVFEAPRKPPAAPFNQYAPDQDLRPDPEEQRAETTQQAQQHASANKN
ncbi:protein PIGBOS1 [Cyprinus carpio]|uniref:Protein PIGBOS1 n=1 Tax=Cyprinus carpio TaxID=7962 RepID=A0A9Q9VJ67_CYPCA|nr:protein PIGBOS1 [Cyprinus carpio]XP_042631661.1 protein PIGBOS1 [Cyprinus carpio]